MRQYLSRLLTALLIAAAPCLTVNLAAREIHVNNTAGSDFNTGDSPQPSAGGHGPCRTIQRALDLMQYGDSVIIANTGEPYRECLTVQGGRQSGRPGNPVVIEGNGAVLEGALPVPAGVWEHVQDHVFRFLPRYQQYQQLYLDGVPAQQVQVTGTDLQVPDLEPREWCQLDGYIYFCIEPDTLPHNYSLTYAYHPVGITLYEARYVKIHDLIVQGFRLDGVNAHDNVVADLTGLTCRGNGRSGISIGGSSQVRIEACLIGNNGTAQIRTEGYSTVEIVDCNLLENTAPPLVIEGGAVTIDGQPVEASP